MVSLMDEKQQALADSFRVLTALFKEDQRTVAEALGVSQVSISRKLAGKSSWSFAEVVLLARRYGVTLDQVQAGPRAWLGLPDGNEGEESGSLDPSVNGSYHLFDPLPVAA